MGLLLDKAIIFAVNAHRGQLRKGSNAPYILHPMEAAAIVAAMTDDEEVIAVAVLLVTAFGGPLQLWMTAGERQRRRCHPVV